MSKQLVTVHYHDFHPSEQTRFFIDSIVNEIHRELPQGSTVSATFSLKDKIVKGMLHVGSYGGPFFSVAAAEDLKEVTVKLLEQMRRRIDKFKTKKYHRREGLKQVAKRKVLKEDVGYDAGVA
jgi:hypothetical protein